MLGWQGAPEHSSKVWSFLPTPSLLMIFLLGLVFKKVPGEFRLIHNLLFPRIDSVNDTVDPTICIANYASFKAVVDMVRALGPTVLMTKYDIESAFQLLHVHAMICLSEVLLL